MAKSKKEKFDQRSKGNSSFMYIVGGIVALLIVVGVIAAWSGQDGTPTVGGAPAGQTGGTIKEVKITPTVADNKVIIKKSEVEQNKIVSFDYEPIKLTLKNGQQVSFPLVSYVAPSGKLVVAVRMCEPCNGLEFSTINGNTLNCDVCGTQWDLESLQWNGVGAQFCGTYAPEPVKFTTNGDNIEINVDDFKNWVPRV